MNLNQNTLMKIIEESRKSGEICNNIETESLYFMLVGPFRFLVTRWRLSNYSFDLVKAFDKYWNSLEGLLKNKPSLAIL